MGFGSSTGTSAIKPQYLESCSFWDATAIGSSPAMITVPAPIRCVLAVMSGSDRRFMPTCFTITIERLPDADAPSAISSATFSLMHHFAPASAIRSSASSVIGYPGTHVMLLRSHSRTADAILSMQGAVSVMVWVATCIFIMHKYLLSAIPKNPARYPNPKSNPSQRDCASAPRCREACARIGNRCTHRRLC